MNHLSVSCLLAISLSLSLSLVQAAPTTPVFSFYDSRVVGGEDASEAQFPHQISLRNSGSHSCGGSIISRNWVLTAAHCVTYYDANATLTAYEPSRLTIRAGSNDRFEGGMLLKVAEVVVHEGYRIFKNDVALLRVATPFIYSARIQAVALPTRNTPANVPIIISGWGRIKHAGDLPRYLQWNTLQSLSLEECDELIDWGVETIICLLHESNNGACNGDSGGPALYNGEVVGIAGFVVGGCGSSNPDGYARVYSFLDWIKQHSDV